MEYLKTATKEFLCDYFNPSKATGQCNLRVLDTPIVEVAAVFSDPTETDRMQFDGVIAEGYTELVAIIPEQNAIRVVLRGNK